MYKKLFRSPTKLIRSRSSRTSFPLFLLSIVLIMGACSEEATKEADEAPTRSTEANSSVGKRKLAFFEKLYPIVRNENERLSKERESVQKGLRKLKKGSELGSRTSKKVQELARKYRVRPKLASKKEGLQELLIKIGPIPPRLALIQAANESNWGRSRFARQGNNLFGQWCFSKGCGIVPKKRSAGAIHEVASFKNIELSVRAYIKNLNSHPAYRPLRSIRHRAMQDGKEATAHDMAGGLKSYAGIGDEYIKILRRMLKSNAALLEKARKNS